MSDLEAPTTELLADWIETSLLVSGSGHLSRDTVFGLAGSEVNRGEAQVAMAWTLMDKRSKVLEEVYPFAVNEFAVRLRHSPWRESYARLLYLTPGSIARQTVRRTETAVMGELLEDLTEVALANLWGAGGTAIAFGFPSKHGRPREFNLAVPWLAEQMGIAAGSGYRPPRRKDGGVDVVAWRQFKDQRPGFPIALAQCTIQAEAFTKTTDIDLRLWASWLATDVDPMSLLVLPGTIRAAGPDWSHLTTVVTIIDRIRLMELLDRGTQAPALSSWTEKTTTALRQVMQASEW